MGLTSHTEELLLPSLARSIVACAAALGLGILGCSMDVSGVDADGANAPSDATDRAPGVVGASSLDVAIETIDPAIVDRAERYLGSFRGTPAAPAWSESAALSGVARAMYRPDVDGPAYYEFPISEGGYVIVSTGKHDVSMTNLSYTARG